MTINEVVEFKFGEGMYRDTGCPEEGGCERSLECKRDDCVLDVPWMDRSVIATAERNRSMARMWAIYGKSISELAIIFKLSERTVHRCLREVRRAS